MSITKSREREYRMQAREIVSRSSGRVIAVVPIMRPQYVGQVEILYDQGAIDRHQADAAMRFRGAWAAGALHPEPATSSAADLGMPPGSGGHDDSERLDAWHRWDRLWRRCQPYSRHILDVVCLDQPVQDLDWLRAGLERV